MRRSLRSRAVLVPLLAFALACKGDDGGAVDDTTGAMSGFTGSGDDGDGDDPAPTSAADSTADDAPWGGTAYQGELRGILTFVFSAPNAARPDARVGLAGGYRNVEVGFDAIEDLYSPLAYQLAFPPLPDDADASMLTAPLPPFAWGGADEWLKAGNGMKLRLGEDGVEALACLVTYFPTMAAPDGYPLYITSSTSAPECDPSPEAFAPAATYDVVLYGGDAFEDNVLLERVTTPAALEVTAPDLSVYDLAIDADAALTFAWIAGDDPDARIVIHLLDADGNVLSVHASDDGEYAIASAELTSLTPGPLDVMIARERTDRVQFTDGGLTVTSRYEHWGFFDLF